MTQRTRRSRLAAATAAAVVAGGVALGLLSGGGAAAQLGDGTVVSQVLAPVVPVTSAVLDGSGSTGGGSAHTEGTRIG